MDERTIQPQATVEIKPPVFKTKQGIANFIDGKIYVHEALEEYDKELYDFAIDHEHTHLTQHLKRGAHTVAGHYVHDLFGNMPFKMFFRSIKFALKHHGAFWQFSPIRIIERYDVDRRTIMVDPPAFVAAFFIVFIAYLISMRFFL